LLVQDYLYLLRVSEREEKRKVYLKALYHKLKFYLNIIIYTYNTDILLMIIIDIYLIIIFIYISCIILPM